jgi:hypothetical protein
LVERTIEAHGGLKRWNELESVTAHLDEGGALWRLKGHPEMLGETNVTVGTRSEWASHHPFLAARARTRFEPHRTALESQNRELIEELKQPRTSPRDLESPKVRFPADVVTHSANQTLYIDGKGLLKRHDYDVDISGGTPAAHYPGEYLEAGGIMFPTMREIFPRQPDDTPNQDLLVVSIRLSNFDLK